MSGFDPYQSFFTPRFAEEISFRHATREQMEELEKAWLAVEPGQRLEAVAAKAMEMGIEITHMHRDRSGKPGLLIRRFEDEGDLE